METKLYSNDRLLGIDGLRGLAVLWVLIEHAGRSWGLQPGTYAFELVNRGGLGVTLFFGISGFVITRLLLRQHLDSGTSGLFAFWRARAARLMPALLVYFAALGVMGLLGGPLIPVGDMVWSGCGLWNYHSLFVAASHSESWWFLGHTWSLSLEQQFYIFWPLALFVWGTGRRVRVAAAALVLISPGMRVASYFHQPETRGMIGMMFHTRMDSMLVGCLLALFESTWRSRIDLERKVGIWALLMGLFCVFLAPWLGLRFRGGYWLTAGFQLDSLLAVLLVMWAVIRSPSWLAGGACSGLGGSPTASICGSSSFWGTQLLPAR